LTEKGNIPPPDRDGGAPSRHRVLVPLLSAVLAVELVGLAWAVVVVLDLVYEYANNLVYHDWDPGVVRTARFLRSWEAAVLLLSMIAAVQVLAGGGTFDRNGRRFTVALIVLLASLPLGFAVFSVLLYRFSSLDPRYQP
jgi:hypothetical protein